MHRILLIEDNTEIRENTAEILELAGYTVYTASNGKEGVQTALQQLPDIIVCDIMMPILDGYGVLHALQKNIQFPNVPFIFLSAKNEKQDIRTGMQLGADDYITKPFDPTELLQAIESRLKKHNEVKKQLEQLPSTNTEELINFTTIIKEATIQLYTKKEVIYKTNTWPTGIYYIHTGKIKAVKRNNDGKELITSLYSNGDFFGYTSLLENNIHTETTEALEDSSVGFISKPIFEKIIKSNPIVIKQFITLLTKNVLEKEEQLLAIAYSSLRKKVADALVKLYHTYKIKNENVAIQISRENLATLAGTATESLIRTLSDFKQEKIIEIKDGTIVILQADKLIYMKN